MRMINNKTKGYPKSPAKINLRRKKLSSLLSSNHDHHFNYDTISSNSSSSSSPYSSNSSSLTSPYSCSSSTQPSPYMKSPWGVATNYNPNDHHDHDHDDNTCNSFTKYGLIASIHREQQGHIYSLAASKDLLYTGSDSKNVRVWKNLQDFSGFKSCSGLVKAIVVFNDKIFTGHQDGKIRVWGLSDEYHKETGNNHKYYTRLGSLPMARDLFTTSMNPKNYIEVRRKRHIPWIKHYDAVSCMSVDVDHGLLYSGSWDRTLKVWRVFDSKCLESTEAHDDSVNSVVVAFGGMVFTGSADGTVKAWRREIVGKYTKHTLVETLLNQEHALTSLAVSTHHDEQADIGTLYAGSSDGLVSFWERCDDQKNYNMSYGGVLRGHKLAVLCLAVGGNLVMSGSADKSICVWRRDVGGAHVCVAVLTGHSGPVKCLAVEKDIHVNEEDEEKEEGCEENERWIVYSGSLDKSVKVWRVSEHTPSMKELQDQE